MRYSITKEISLCIDITTGNVAILISPKAGNITVRLAEGLDASADEDS
jgi:hypothetical protein